MFSHTNFWVSVGEPWDFTSTSGNNKLTGQVIKSLSFKEKPYLLCKISPFLYDNEMIDTVIIYKRYSDNQDLLNPPKEGIVVNIGFVKGAINLESENLLSNSFISKFNSFLVGTLYFEE